MSIMCVYDVIGSRELLIKPVPTPKMVSTNTKIKTVRTK